MTKTRWAFGPPHLTSCAQQLLSKKQAITNKGRENNLPAFFVGKLIQSVSYSRFWL